MNKSVRRKPNLSSTQQARLALSKMPKARRSRCCQNVVGRIVLQRSPYCNEFWLKGAVSNHFETALLFTANERKIGPKRQKTAHKHRGVHFTSQKVRCFLNWGIKPYRVQKGSFPTGLFVFYDAASKCYTPCSQDTILI